MEDWEELPLTSEDQPLRLPKYPKSYTQDEADWMATGFTAREISPQVIKIWLVLQVISLLFEFNLWLEVSSHLADFEDVLSRECSQHQLHGICAGSSWNASAFEDFSLTGHQTHFFHFATKSVPPTFLLVVDPLKSVEAPSEDWQEPEQELRDVRWSLEVQRLNPPQRVPPMKAVRAGQQVFTGEDLSEEASAALRSQSSVQWQAIVQASGFYRHPVRRGK
ncbi:unnamed protein product [Effrenium voratum]|nr:unnamed protein product [Effrenium voratum]